MKCLVFLHEGTSELCIQRGKYTATVGEYASISVNCTWFSDKAFLEIFEILTTQHTILIQFHKPIVMNVTDHSVLREAERAFSAMVRDIEKRSTGMNSWQKIIKIGRRT